MRQDACAPHARGSLGDSGCLPHAPFCGVVSALPACQPSIKCCWTACSTSHALHTCRTSKHGTGVAPRPMLPIGSLNPYNNNWAVRAKVVTKGAKRRWVRTGSKGMPRRMGSRPPPPPPPRLRAQL